MEKFSYYDTIADLIPGIVSIWAFSFLGPFKDIDYSLLLTNNQIIDAVLFISISFIIGHIIKFISKCTVEPLLKFIFWKCKFFSEIYLIKSLEFCPQIELHNIYSLAESKLKLSKNDLKILRQRDAYSDESKRKRAIQLSQMIFRKLDAQSKDTSKAKKAHTQNVFYGLFRNLSTLFLVITILNIMAAMFKFNQNISLLNVVNSTIISGVITFVFFIRAKQRGESYVKGVFWSITSD